MTRVCGGFIVHVMNTESYRELKALEAIAADSSVTQRHLAKRLEVALGLTNLMIRRLVTKGYVKAVNIQRNRIRYLITPKGIAEKTRLTYEFLEYSLYLYRTVREVVKTSLARLVPSGGASIVCFGAGEISEIAYITLKALGHTLVAVVDDRLVGQTFLGLPVLSSAAIPTLTYDCGILSSLHEDVEQLQTRLAQLGVPEEKVIVIQRDGADVPAVDGALQPLR